MKNIKKYLVNICKSINSYWEKFINIKFINIIFKVLPHNLFLFLLFLISFIILFNTYVDNHYDFVYSQEKANELMDPLLIYSQDISLENVTLDAVPDKVCFMFATYGRVNNAIIDLSLFKDNELVYNIPIDARLLKDKEMYCEVIPMVLNNDNVRDYKIVIRPLQTDSSNTVAMLKDSETNQPALFFARSIPLFSLRNIITMIFIILFFVINYFVNKRKIMVHNVWLLFSLIYILPLTLLIPPYQVPDEPVHFYNAYKLSQLDFSKSLADNFKDQTLEMPSNMSELNYSSYPNVDKVYDKSRIIDALNEGDNNVVHLKTNYFSNKSKIGYIFSSLGIKLADIFTNSPLIIFYTGRLFNMLVSLIIIYFAIKKAPKYKEAILMTATIPMFIQGMISYSYDSILNSLILLATSIMLNMIYEKKNNFILYSIVLLICGTFIANIKNIYLPIFLLLLLIPDDKYKKKYYKWIYCIVIILLSYLLGKITRGIFTSSNATTGLVAIANKSNNMQYILKNPLMILPIAFNTFKNNGLYYLKSTFGYFGWFRYELNNIFIVAYIILIIYIVLTNESINSKKIPKVINTIGHLVSFAAVFASMYFLWSADKLDYVDGVQGRYFLPLILGFIIICLPKKIKLKQNLNNIYLFINIVLLHYLLLILFCYY